MVENGGTLVLGPMSLQPPGVSKGEIVMSSVRRSGASRLTTENLSRSAALASPTAPSRGQTSSRPYSTLSSVTSDFSEEGILERCSPRASRNHRPLSVRTGLGLDGVDWGERPQSPLASPSAVGLFRETRMERLGKGLLMVLHGDPLNSARVGLFPETWMERLGKRLHMVLRKDPLNSARVRLF
eukprot:gene17980-24386_t